MKVFGITGRKNSGKTDLVVRLVAHFTGLGLRVATVKHAHCAAETDRSGTDSHRHRAAGAAQVVLSTPDRWALMTELRGTDEPSLKALIDRLDPCDLVLVEGFKSARIPKIECHRPATGQPLLGRIYAVSAIAAPGGQVGSDLPDPDAPVLDLDDTAAIARFIQDQLAAGGARAAMPSGVDWLPVDEAQARLRAALTPLQGAEDLPIAQAAGRVLAQDAVAVRANPPRANSAVDGYGYAAAHAAPTMPLTPGRAAAGAPFSGTVPAGQALRILTGAILPEGVDTVALQEDAHHGDGTVRLDRMPKPGANTRPAGEDLNEGATALPAGRRLTPADLALAAATGIATVRVRPRLRVAVLSTGDEIVPTPGDPALPHQIWDANRPMLLAMAAGWQGLPVDLGHAPDDPRGIADALDRGAREADLILTSGGTSAGDEDHVSRLLSERGNLTAWRIAMKPGRPLALAFWNGVPVIGLPGNPVAAMVCAMIFAAPAAALIAGEGWRAPQGYALPAAFHKTKRAGRREYLRARLTPEGAAEVFASEGSGRISGLSWATGLVELPDGAAVIEPGDPVRYLPFPWA